MTASDSSVPGGLSLAATQRKYPHLSVPSPCVGVCKMSEATGWCTGCFRRLDEIAGWGRLDDASKRALWGVVEQRQVDLAKVSA